MKSIRGLYNKVAYSDKTHNILNNFTLQISDPEIHKQYDQERFENLDALFWPMFVASLSFCLYRVIQFLTLGTQLIKLVYGSEILFTVVIWALLRCRLKRLAPFLTYLFLLWRCMSVNLQVRGILPDIITNSDLKTEEYRIYIAVVIAHCSNYNTFLQTVCISVPIVMISAYFMLKAKV